MKYLLVVVGLYLAGIAVVSAMYGIKAAADNVWLIMAAVGAPVAAVKFAKDLD